MSWASELVKAVQKPRFAFAGLVACGVCLMWGAVFPTNAGVFVSLRPWLVLAALACGGLLAWDVVAALVRAVQSQLARKRTIRELSNLTEDERKKLAFWVERDIRSGGLERDGATASLVHRGVLVWVEDSRTYKTIATYIIPSFLWEHLKKHPDALKERK